MENHVVSKISGDQMAIPTGLCFDLETRRDRQGVCEISLDIGAETKRV